MPTFDTLLYSIEDGIATITLNRPERMNALTLPMVSELLSVFDHTDADDAVRAVIVTGAGDRAFCAGADLSQGEATFAYQHKSGPEERLVVNGIYRDSGGRIALRIFDSLKPVIGAVNGVAVGFGATVLLPMDFRIAADTARFGFVFVRRGILPETTSTWFLPRLVGISTALEWCYSGRLVGAQEALQRNLVSALHPPTELMAAARALARSFIDSSAPVAVSLTRQMMWRMLGSDHPMEAHMIESRGLTARGSSADAKEGISAFMEKRSAHFPDKVSSDMPGFYPWWQERKFE
jgi:enoyl-CoA hydratase/carnithine racemase